MAMSVPVPIAIPTSAWASAGASLIPSPTIATTCPLLQPLHLGDLAFRQHAGDDVIDADLPGDRRRRRAPIAGQQDDVEAAGAQRADGLGRAAA